MASPFESTTVNTVEPPAWLLEALEGGVDNIEDLMAAGPWAGAYAPEMNAGQTGGFDAGMDVAGQMGDTGAALAPGLETSNNYWNDVMGQDSTSGWVNNPDQYFGMAEDFAANPHVDSMIDSIMTDPFREFSETAMPGVAQAYGGDMAGAHRRGITEGVLQRGYEDRYSDVSADVRGGLWNTGLGMADDAQRNDFLDKGAAADKVGAYGGMGFDMMNAGADSQAKWGDYQFGNEQTQIDADMREYYEPWRLQEAYDQSITPLATGLASSSQTTDPGWVAPLVNIFGQIAAGSFAGGNIPDWLKELLGIS